MSALTAWTIIWKSINKTLCLLGRTDGQPKNLMPLAFTITGGGMSGIGTADYFMHFKISQNQCLTCSPWVMILWSLAAFEAHFLASLTRHPSASEAQNSCRADTCTTEKRPSFLHSWVFQVSFVYISRMQLQQPIVNTILLKAWRNCSSSGYTYERD